MTVAVVGSGPTGVAAASALLEHGIAVDLFDVGHEAEPAASELARRLRADHTDGAALRALRESGPQTQRGVLAAARLLLGRRAPEGMVEKTRLGSAFTFRDVEHGIPLEGARVPRSLARGGLSNVWGAACYPLRPADYERWPVPESEMAPHYRAAARLLGLEETTDDLAGVYPVYGESGGAPPVVSGTAASLLACWQEHAERLHALGVRFGRARTAVRLTGEMNAADATEEDFEAGRVGCQRCGLCLWGCPWDAIYRSTRTLAALRAMPGFRYRPGFLVQRVREREGAVRLEGAEIVGPYRAVFLAAGPLSSLRIAAESLGAQGVARPVLDNDMYLVPSLRVARSVPRDDGGAFALSEAVLTLDGSRLDMQAIHVQLYSYGELLARGMRGSLPRLVASLPAALLDRLLVAFVYLHSDDSVRASATVVPAPEGARVRLDHAPHPKSRARLGAVLRLARREPRAFGFLPLTAKSTHLGFSGHLCGTLPMRRDPGILDTEVDGRLAGTRVVYVVDSSTFPILPAQNLTYSAMANARRIATGYAMRTHASGRQAALGSTN